MHPWLGRYIKKWASVKIEKIQIHIGNNNKLKVCSIYFVLCALIVRHATQKNAKIPSMNMQKVDKNDRDDEHRLCLPVMSALKVSKRCNKNHVNFTQDALNLNDLPLKFSYSILGMASLLLLKEKRF